MINVRLDFDQRKGQIEKYLGFLWIVDYRISIPNLQTIASNKITLDDGSELTLASFLSGTNYVIDSELVRILKSNTILLFYNLIEGTISSLMNEYFDSLNSNPTAYKELKPEIKRIWLRYRHRSFSVGEKKNEKYIVRTIDSIIDEIVQIEPKSIQDSSSGTGTRTIYNFDAFNAETNSKDISGNLDARKIKNIFKLYGLPEITQNCDSMLSVKNKRNSLAHGNETFTEVGRNFSIDDLFKMNHEIISFLETLISETDTFLTNQDYKLSTA